MRQKYYPPVFQGKEFHCIHCGVFAAQSWSDLLMHKVNSTNLPPTPLNASSCFHCGKHIFWYQKRMIVPSEAPVEPPHEDMPDDCTVDYNEAREIFVRSPRSSAALLRLCLQKLMPHLGESGKNLNNDIGSLVSKGLPLLVQKALDVCRVIGNNAVHPGEIDLNDTPEIAQQLFSLINFIIEERISRPKEIEAFYDKLPESSKEQIKKRDNGQG